MCVQQLLRCSFFYHYLFPGRKRKIHWGERCSNIKRYPVMFCAQGETVSPNLVSSITWKYNNRLNWFSDLWKENQIILSAPFEATRSAPTMTPSTRPSFISAAAAESAMRVAGIFSCTNSNAVSLDPCQWSFNNCSSNGGKYSRIIWSQKQLVVFNGFLQILKCKK